MSSNTYLIDAATRHAVFVQRFAGGESKKAQAMVQRLLDDVNARLLREPTEFIESRLLTLRQDFEFLLEQFSEKLRDDTVQMSLDFAVAEASFSQRIMSEATTVDFVVPSEAALSAAVLRQGMDTPLGPDQITIEQALNQFSRNKSREIFNAVNDGVLTGKTTREIANDVSALSTRQRRQVDTLTRTVVNHVSAQARNTLINENEGILEGYEWVATLDSRTTLICGGRDGNIYPVNSGPRPPAHWNCRSTVVPVVREEYRNDNVTGRRGAVSVDAAGNETRKQVSAQTTYGGWLKKQPASFQDEVLGDTRAKLFRSGGLAIDKFRDETGRTYSLAQLQKLEPLAFERANITTAAATAARKKVVPRMTKRQAAVVTRTKPKATYTKQPKPKERPTVEVDKKTATASSVPKRPSLTRQEVGEIEYYKGDGFYEMNNALRNPSSVAEPTLKAAQSRMDALNKAIDKSKTTQDHSFYRGIRSGDMFANAENMVGKELKNLTPQSTTISKSVANNYAGIVGGKYTAEPGGSVIMKINVKKGSSALNVGATTGINAAEKEILLKGGSSYRVKGVKTIKDEFGVDIYKEIEVDYVE